MKEDYVPIIVLGLIIVGLLWVAVAIENRSISKGQKQCDQYGNGYKYQDALYGAGYCTNLQTGEMKGLK